MEKVFDPTSLEPRIRNRWDQENAWKAGAGHVDGQPAYSIVIPPPNVTGSLHMGHALNNTLQDILIRFERMRGKNVLWQVGLDHAGIATQMVVERQLAAAGLPDRRDMGREKFLDTVWEWKSQSGGTIIHQLKRLGASCDWERERFTMDEGLSKAVTKVFVDLFNEGLIYRDKRLVNWDPHFQTAISDLEVVQVEKKGSFKWSRTPAEGEEPQELNKALLRKTLERDPHGHMYYLAYPLESGEGHIMVATTRPETMLGDTAVAVHPEDERYQAYVGQNVRLPLTGRLIPIVADTYTDPEKGTGAVKITPAHDFNDFEVGQRHGLDKISVIDFSACIKDEYPFGSMDRYAARIAIVEQLVDDGVLQKIEPITHTVPHGDRSNVAIEPLLTDQWYVNVKPLAEKAMAAVRQGDMAFVPKNWEKTYFEWLENIQPWCISRQLWWGHQIPAWYGPDGHVIVAATDEEARIRARAHYGTSVVLTRDEDVLDTWFSSALWPFSTQGWPDDTADMKTYYPTATLITGFDIIFFWVARMMMMGLHFTGQVPFKQVYIHALVRDERGQKMSKSKGNVIDPLDLMDKYGADSLRFTLCAMAAQGRDIKLSEQRVAGYRNFATKIWNAARFCEMNGCLSIAGEAGSLQHPVNMWIRRELHQAVAEVTKALEEYRFNDAAATLYRFFWNTYCDWYLELAKPIFAKQDETSDETRRVARDVLHDALKLLHPFMPYITDALAEAMAEAQSQTQPVLALQAWPQKQELPAEAAAQAIESLIDVISAVRSVRSELNVPANAQVPLVLECGALADVLMPFEAEIKRLAKSESVTSAQVAPRGAIEVLVGTSKVWLLVADHIDLAAEKQRMAKELSKLDADIAQITAKLGNPDFVARAPEEVVEEQQERREIATIRRQSLLKAKAALDAA